MSACLLLIISSTALAQVSYDSGKGLLSVKSDGRLLSAILSEISAAARVNIYMSPASDKKVYVEIEKSPLDIALRRLVRPLNYAFVYSGSKVKDIKVFERSEAEATARIEPLAPGRVSGGAVTTKPLTREEAEAAALERRRKIAESQGRLAEFERQEAERAKRSEKIRNIKEQREKERERLRSQIEERKKNSQQ